MSIKKRILWLFNLETNLDSPLLAVSHAWIYEFSKYFDQVEVFSTHVGRYDLPNNVTVNEIGGGNLLARLNGMFVLTRVFFKILLNRNHSYVFHHMSSRTAALLGVGLKIIGVRQSLWYSHLHSSSSLKLSILLCENIFTASPKSVGFTAKNLYFVGHAVPVDIFKKIDLSGPRSGIISVGRISPVKRLETVINLLSSEDLKLDEQYKNVSLVGPKNLTPEYTRKIEKLATQTGINVNFLGTRNHSELPELLSKYSVYFTGTRGGVDKAAIEAALSGCFVISDNQEALRITGMQNIYRSLGLNGDTELKEQLECIQRISDKEFGLRKYLQEYGFANNSLSLLVQEIARRMLHEI